MIRFVIENGNNWLKFDAPTDELFDHLGSIGIYKDIPIGGTENVSVDYYPTEDDDKIAKIVCDRLLLLATTRAQVSTAKILSRKGFKSRLHLFGNNPV